MPLKKSTIVKITLSIRIGSHRHLKQRIALLLRKFLSILLRQPVGIHLK